MSPIEEGDEMTIRRVFHTSLVLVLLSVLGLAQDKDSPFFTKGQPNGVLWNTLSEKEKSVVVMGAGVGK